MCSAANTIYQKCPLLLWAALTLPHWKHETHFHPHLLSLTSDYDFCMTVTSLSRVSSDKHRELLCHSLYHKMWQWCWPWPCTIYVLHSIGFNINIYYTITEKLKLINKQIVWHHIYDQRKGSTHSLTHWSAEVPLCRADRTQALCLSGPAAPHTPSCSLDGSIQNHCKGSEDARMVSKGGKNNLLLL